VHAAHDCSEGGIAVALAEMCISGGRLVGATVKLAEGIRADQLLFGEAPSRILVAFDPDREAELRKLADAAQAPFTVLGAVGGRNLTIFIGNARTVDAPLQDLAAAWRGGFRAVVTDRA
jgi:phosphoribosylformylglycinamidine synthase